MVVLPPTRHSSPSLVSRRMCTLSHTLVPSPSETLASIIAVGWMRTGMLRSLSKRSGKMVLYRHPGSPPHRVVAGFDDFDGGEGVGQRNQRSLFAAGGFDEVIKLTAEGLELVITLAEDGPLLIAGPAVF